MDKIDLKKEYKELYNASAKEACIVDVPVFNYLMIDGKGDPNTSPEFTPAVEALYGTAYTLKFMVKSKTGKDFAVMPLEGLWWCDDMNNFSIERKNEWKWRLMIMMPDFITATDINETKEILKKKKDNINTDNIRFEEYNEGKCAQIMHIGPYADEEPTVQKLHDYIKTHNLTLRGLHHEIYLGDPRRSAPEKLKTIIRQPVE